MSRADDLQALHACLPAVSAPVLAPDLADGSLYINRELSQLQFNVRVLDQALDERIPLLERLKFLLIFSRNMDEFFEIRVAGLKRQIAFDHAFSGPDGMEPRRVLARISEIAHHHIERQYEILNERILPGLEAHGIRIVRRESWTPRQAQWLRHYFRHEVAPLVTPIGLDPTHPFPLLVNKSLNFIVQLRGVDAFGRNASLAIVPAPRVLPRLIRLPGEEPGKGDDHVLLSSIIHAQVAELFPGMEVLGCYQFRLTRNADLVLDPEDVEDLALALQGELYSRRFGDAVRLEVADNCPADLVRFMLGRFGLGQADLYEVDGPVNLARLFPLAGIDRPAMRFPAFSCVLPRALKKSPNLFQAIARQGLLLLHPYESFVPVADLLRQAAKDADVLTIKQTLYRSGAHSEIVNALVDAARAGKEVTVVVELRARFDEASNLELAARLQKAGATVVYGVVGVKTHAKLLLIQRREGNRLVRYAHMGTGNYHTGNARLYTDYSLLTADKALCEDAHQLFTQLTGMGKLLPMKKILHAPFTLKRTLLRLIAGETSRAAAGDGARIILKVNALTDARIIRALYRASMAGVSIDLIVRGMCCLRPGVPGFSDNIRVRSIIGRFLEHSRIYWFGNGGDEIVYLSSADLMERNLDRRIEVAFPVEIKRHRRRIREHLELYLADNVGASLLQPSGDYLRPAPEDGQEACSAQEQLQERAGSGGEA
ncbi:MAG TPA: polyphosphate kinase 1 [Frateuria sp.]|nr:polyphosphate kinase 1 [Frateuria sp.]